MISLPDRVSDWSFREALLFPCLGVGEYMEAGQCRLEFAGPRHKISQLAFTLVTPFSLARYPFKTKCSTNHVAQERLAAHSPLCENLFALKNACNIRTGVVGAGANHPFDFPEMSIDNLKNCRGVYKVAHKKSPLSHARVLVRVG